MRQTGKTPKARRFRLPVVYRWQRPVWMRNDTMRWLDERSAGVLAWLRRRDPRAPAHSGAMGRWLRENRPPDFRRAHERLIAAGSNRGGLNRLTLLEALN